MEIVEFIETIKTKEDFITYIKLLRNIYDKKNEDWENKDIESYLSGIHGFVYGLDGYFANNNIEDKEPSWKLFAIILFAATIYD